MLFRGWNIGVNGWCSVYRVNERPNKFTWKALIPRTIVKTSLSLCMGGSRTLKWGVNFCNNVREIKYYFNIWGIRTKKERRGLRKRGVKIHPFHLPWIRACSGYTFAQFLWASFKQKLWVAGYRCSSRGIVPIPTGDASQARGSGRLGS